MRSNAIVDDFLLLIALLWYAELRGKKEADEN